MNNPQPTERGEWTSASSAAADKLCAGRFQAQKGLPEEQSHASEFGNLVHAAFEGQDVDLNLTQERLLSLAEAREKEVLGLVGEDGWDEFRERRLWVEWKATKLRHSGQADRLFTNMAKGVAVVEDLKSLRGYVPDSASNAQLRDLAGLVYANFPVNSVIVFVNQPLAKGAQTYTRYDLTALQQAFDEMTDRVRRSHDPKAGRVAGEEQCKFCRARGTCPEALEWTGHTVVPVKSATGLSKTASPLMLAEVFRRTPAIYSILEKVKANLLAMPDTELEALGLKRVEGHFRETITDTNELFNRLEKLGVTDAQMVEISKVGKGDLEKVVRESTGLKGGPLKDKLKELTEGIVDRKQTAATLERTV